MRMFMGRQPIFERNKKIFGYEIKVEEDLMSLLDSHLKLGHTSKNEQPTDQDLNFWVHLLSQDNKTILNFPNLEVIDDLPSVGLLSNAVFGLMNDLDESQDHVNKIEYLKNSGCQFLFNGLDQLYTNSDLLSKMDIMQVDIQETEMDGDEPGFEIAHERGLRILVKNVETHEEFQWAHDHGVDYFMGGFFKTPCLTTDRAIMVNQISHFQLLKELHQPQIRLNRLEHIISRDATLTFKILEFINSAHVGTRFRIHSIQHALSMLGEQEIQKWATLVIVSIMSQHKPPELLTTALIRAHFCEEMAVHSGQGNLKHECFFLGLISVLDAILDLEMEVLLKRLPVSSLIAQALMGSTDNPMSLLLQLIIYYEESNWFKLAETAHRLRVEENLVVKTYIDALEFASQDMGI